MPPCIMVSLHLAIAFFCFVFFSLGKKDKFRRNNGCVKSCYTYQEPLPTWSEEDNNIQFTLQVCVLWQFQSSVKFIYLFVMIHKGFSSLWMCGISLWWILFTLQFMTNISLVIFHTTKDPSLTVLNSHVEVQWYATNVHPMSTATTFLCVLSSYNFINSLCTDNIFVSNYCFAFVSFVYFLNIYTLIQVTSSQETISSYYHGSK